MAVFTVESYFVEATTYRPIFGPTQVIDPMSVLIVEKLLHVEITFRITDGHTQERNLTNVTPVRSPTVSLTIY